MIVDMFSYMSVYVGYFKVPSGYMAISRFFPTYWVSCMGLVLLLVSCFRRIPHCGGLHVFHATVS
jgi:hypothetical protein